MSTIEDAFWFVVGNTMRAGLFAIGVWCLYNAAVVS